MPGPITSDEPLFAAAVARLLEREGGFSDDPVDHGGATKYGVSLAFARAIGDSDGDGWADFDLDHDGDVDAEDIRKLTRDQAIGAYKVHFWDRYGYARLRLIVASKVFDLSVNMGPKLAHKVLQRSIRACGVACLDDGVLGPKTAFACVAPDDGELRAALRAEAAGVYRSIVTAVPSQDRFLGGWLRRAYDEP